LSARVFDGRSKHCVVGFRQAGEGVGGGGGLLLFSFFIGLVVFFFFFSWFWGHFLPRSWGFGSFFVGGGEGGSLFAGRRPGNRNRARQKNHSAVWAWVCGVERQGGSLGARKIRNAGQRYLVGARGGGGRQAPRPPQPTTRPPKAWRCWSGGLLKKATLARRPLMCF